MKLHDPSAPLLAADRSIRNWILGGLTIAMFFFFGLPKLMGDPTSVKGFQQFSPVLGLDPDFFRIFTGATEILIALLLFASLIIGKFRPGLQLAGFLGTVATMGGALVVEFFARTKPAIPLVIIALIFIAIAVVQLKAFRADQKSVKSL